MRFSRSTVLLVGVGISFASNRCLYSTDIVEQPPLPIARPELTNLHVIFVPSEFDPDNGIGYRIRNRVEASFPGSTVSIRAWRRDVAHGRVTEPDLSDADEAILISGGRGFGCGTGSALAFVSGTLLPGAGGSAYSWTVTGPGRDSAHVIWYRANERYWIWLPLAPFMPINIIWRKISGDSEERFLAALPDLIVLAVSDGEKPVRP